MSSGLYFAGFVVPANGILLDVSVMNKGWVDWHLYPLLPVLPPGVLDQQVLLWQELF